MNSRLFLKLLCILLCFIINYNSCEIYISGPKELREQFRYEDKSIKYFLYKL